MYLFSKNKGADLCLCFHACKKQVFSQRSTSQAYSKRQKMYDVDSEIFAVAWID